jgi:hypothetical protein
MTKSQAGKLGAEKARAFHKERKRLNEIKYLQSPKRCLQCNNIIFYDQRANNFCGSSCSATYNNLRKDSGVPCLNCSKLLKGNRNRKFCNGTCQGQYNWKLTKESIVSGNLTNITDASIKRYLLETQGRTCSMCKLTTWNGLPIPIEMDHIDGRPDINRGLNNCRLLCPNCHTQTPTYGVKNKGNGRWLRRKRYSLGLST